MHTEPLKQHILRFIQLDSTRLKEVLNHFTSFSFKKKQIILNPGTICNYDYYIASGALHLSQINTHSGAEELLSLAISDYWITDLDSFRNRTPSNCTIQAEKNTEVLAISREGFDKACKEIPQIERYFRLMTEKHLISWMNRIYMRNALSAKERLDHFISNYPALYEAFPRYLIASYLGMSAEMLSKLRSRKR